MAKPRGAKLSKSNGHKEDQFKIQSDANVFHKKTYKHMSIGFCAIFGFFLWFWITSDNMPIAFFTSTFKFVVEGEPVKLICQLRESLVVVFNTILWAQNVMFSLIP